MKVEFVKQAVKSINMHIDRVNDLLRDISYELDFRGSIHDESKLQSVELYPLAEMEELIATEGPAPYGTEEYKRRTELLGPMLEHHYKYNSHHPEHYTNGIAGMDVLDLVEMLCDWKAASERNQDEMVNITYSCERYKIDGLLKAIIVNTFERKGWKWK